MFRGLSAKVAGALRIALAAALFATGPAAQAQLSQYAQGPMYQLNVRGYPLYCEAYSGQLVAIFIDPALNNIGIASNYGGDPYIVLNPNQVGHYSDLVAVWWFAHECAHHALGPANNETNADCFAIKKMRQVGILTQPNQLNAFSWELQHLQGSPMGHLPGPMRAQNIVNCALY